jgi:ribosomal protein S27AE
MDENLDKHWRALSEEILSGMKEWRLAHPNATFREIEDAVHERVSRLEAQMIQDTVQADERSEWAQGPAKFRPSCPNCGVPLVSRGKRQRVLQSRGGQPIKVQRTYGTCPQCGMGLFPPG